MSFKCECGNDMLYNTSIDGEDINRDEEIVFVYSCPNESCNNIAYVIKGNNEE